MRYRNRPHRTANRSVRRVVPAAAVAIATVGLGSTVALADDAPVDPEIAVGDLDLQAPMFVPTIYELDPVVVPDVIDLLAPRDDRPDREEREDRKGGPAHVAPTDDYEWGGDSGLYIGGVEPGCLVGCVTSALISAKPTSPDVGFDIHTTVPTRFDVTVARIDTGALLHFSNGGYDTEWSTTLGPLTAGEDYALLVQVNDESGFEQILTHEFTAPDPIAPQWGFSGEVTGCAAQCIERGVVRTTDEADHVVVEVETSVDAYITVWVSTLPPVMVDGIPTLPDSAVVASPALAGTEWEFGVDGLATGTLHHIVVRAEDGNGAAAYRAGEFSTGKELPQVVEATIRWAFIQADGDVGLPFGGPDKGEIRFFWGTEDAVTGYREEAKLKAGDTVFFDEDDDNTLYALATSDLAFPSIGFAAAERDWQPFQFGQWLPAFPPPAPYAGTYMTTNVVWTFPMTLDDIEDLPECGDWAEGADWADDRCVNIFSPDPGPNYAKFQLMISYRVIS